MVFMFMSFLKPHKVAAALGVTTSALRMRRFRGSETIDYIVNNKGRVMYDAKSLEDHINSFSSPPRVGKSIPRVTTSDAFDKPKRSHATLTTDHRYMHSIGKINERRIKQKAKTIEQEIVEDRENQEYLKAQVREARLKKHNTIRKENDYIRWVHKNEMTPNWKPIHTAPKVKKGFSYY